MSIKTAAFLLAICADVAHASHAFSMENRMASGIIRDVDVAMETRGRPPRRCSYLPVDGCTCISNFGRYVISCVELGLSSVPNLEVIPNNAKVILDLSYNQIRRINSSAFDGVKLQKFVMKHNRWIGDDGLVGNLAITYNAFETQKQLTYIDMTNASIASDLPLAFSKTGNLRTLILSYNRISYLGRSFEGYSKLTQFELEGNRLIAMHQEAFKRMVKLTHLSITVFSILSANMFSEFLPCGDLSDLEILVVKHSDVKDQIRDVINENCLTSLKSLTCQNCRFEDYHLRSIPKEISRKFEKLDLSHNNFGNLIVANLVGYGNGHAVSTKLPKLQVLDLSHNNIVNIEMSDADRFLPSLTSLDLSNNQLTSISAGFYLLPVLEEMDLSQNKLEAVGEVFNTVDLDLEETGLKISAAGNPFTCDCNLRWFINQVKSQVSGEPGPLMLHEIDEYTCNKPDIRKGKLLSELTPDDSSCRINQ